MYLTYRTAPAAGGLQFVPVRRSVRKLPAALSLGTPVFDRLAWERGNPLDGGARPLVGDVVRGMFATVGAL